MAKADAAKPAPKPQAAPKPGSPAKAQPRKDKTPDTQPAIAKGRPKGTGQVPARLKDIYAKTVVPALMKERGYTNVWAVPRLNKIVLNMGVGEGRDNAKILDFATADLQAITGQRPVVTRAKKSIANFKLREGVPIGIALPRVRDFKGVPPKGFDGRGNYALGLREQLIFPEIVYDKIDKVRGMDIIFVTTARTDEEARALLGHLGMPFREQ
jgi:large subunit ribosomal protein L5